MRLPPHTKSDVQIILPPPPIRDPVAWDSGRSAGPNSGSLADAVLVFVIGKMSSSEFRSAVTSRGVWPSAELDQLIRSHEADNSRTVGEFTRVLIRMGVDEMTGPGGAGTELPTGPERPFNTTRGRKNIQSDPEMLTWK